MERAFESQPSNAAIQGELQRLYGRRDGMEPPKVRMTRGALAHMYVQGELYPQAIAEIRAVLGQDPQRADMQVLLARAYFKSGQKADAADMCTQLLKRYPYCFDANRIMVELTPSSVGAAESTQVYRTRVGELDPYVAFSKGSVFQSNEVADAAVSLERLEYAGDEASMEQGWTPSLGSGLSTSSALAAATSSEQPDWLKGFSSSPSDSVTSTDPFAAAQDAAAPALQSQDGIPDFLRSAGWGESSGEPEKPVSFFDTPDPVGGDLAPADVPDWLKGQMPSGSAPTLNLNPIESSPSQAIDTPDWLSGLGGIQPAESVPAESNNTPDWLSGLGSAQPAAESTSNESSNTPDWLSGLGGGQPAESLPPEAGSAPDWLTGSSGGQLAESAPAASSETPPDWLSSLGNAQPAESAAPSDAPDWLSGGQPSTSSAPSQDNEPAQPADVPDWLSGSSSQPAQPVNNSIESLGTSAQEQDDAVAWLESLAAKHGAKPEELVTDPNKRSETPPEWVEQARAASQAQPTSQPAASVENLGTSAQEQDDAVAWLESLAAKHGAKPEELVTDPNKRSDTPPDWVQQARIAAEAQPTAPAQWSENAQNIGEQFFNEFEDGSASTSASEDETGVWLRGQEEKEKHEQTAAPVSDMPDWMSDTKEPAVDSGSPAEKADVPDWLGGMRDESAAQEFTPNVQHLSGGDLSDWLSGLDENPVVTPSATSTPGDLPEWLSDVDSQDQKSEDDWNNKSTEQKPAAAPASNWTEEPATASIESDLPGWLQGVDGETAKATQDNANDAEWFEKESDAETQLKPTSPSDWQPVEPKLEQPRKADLGSRPPMPKPKPSAMPPSKEPVYESIDKESEWPSEDPPIIQTRKPMAPAAPPMVTRQSALQPAMQSQPVVQAQPNAQKPIPSKKNGGRAPETMPGPSALIQAKDELDRGDIPAALEHYGKLIKKGKHLEETIRDLSESIYRYPVEVGIWQTLGDAYMRGNRLKEALEAYNKAEELIR